MKMPIVALTLLGALALAGCSANSPAPDASSSSPSTAASCEGVEVVVDFGTLDAPAITECVDAGETPTVAASAALQTAGVTTEGSVEWGDQIVCRVNDRPSADETVVVDGEESFIESCASMPPTYAYWALWVKSAADAEWEYAQEGVGTLQLERGQSIGLVFTSGTETPTPGS